MASIVNRIRGAKTTHKLIVPPTAVASIGATYYLVNLVKASLDSSASSTPPQVPEETVTPTESTPAPKTSPGTVAEETNDSESGSSDKVQGDRGVDSATASTQQGEKKLSPESPDAPSPQQQSVANPYSNQETVSERPKEEQKDQKRDSGASQSGEGTPDGLEKKIDIETQIKLLMEFLDTNQKIWLITLDDEYVSLDKLNLQKYIVEKGTPLFKAALLEARKNPAPKASGKTT